MLNAPDASDLLMIARETLLRSVLPAVPEGQRYPVLMIANAMAIAGREAAQREATGTAELSDLEAFYGDPGLQGTPQERLLAYNRRLARDARSGRFEGALAMQFRALLETQVRARLRVGNPKYLTSAP